MGFVTSLGGPVQAFIDQLLKAAGEGCGQLVSEIDGHPFQTVQQINECGYRRGFNKGLLHGKSFTWAIGK